MAEVEGNTERAFRLCIDETGKTNVVRVELCGIARFACWWFVVWSIIGSFIVLVNTITR
jgi:hypothetical protein